MLWNTVRLWLLAYCVHKLFTFVTCINCDVHGSEMYVQTGLFYIWIYILMCETAQAVNALKWSIWLAGMQLSSTVRIMKRFVFLFCVQFCNRLSSRPVPVVFTDIGKMLVRMHRLAWFSWFISIMLPAPSPPSLWYFVDCARQSTATPSSPCTWQALPHLAVSHVLTTMLLNNNISATLHRLIAAFKQGINCIVCKSQLFDGNSMSNVIINSPDFGF